MGLLAPIFQFIDVQSFCKTKYSFLKIACLHLLSMLLFMYMSNWRKIFGKTSQLWWWRWIIHIISYKNKVKVQWSFLTESTNYPSNSEQDFHAIISNDDLMNDVQFSLMIPLLWAGCKMTPAALCSSALCPWAPSCRPACSSLWLFRSRLAVQFGVTFVSFLPAKFGPKAFHRYYGWA